MRLFTVLLMSAALFAQRGQVQVVQKNLAPTPLMGWNSWPTLRAWPSEQAVKDIADGMVYYGLVTAGYTYLGLDAYWAQSKRVNGDLAPTYFFPSGMAALGTYIHGKGLKYGLYSMAGGDCIGLIPGSYDYEGRDAALFAAWGVDLLKYDETCNPQAPSEVEAMQMRKALDSTGRDIVLTSGSGGPYDAIWGYASGAQSVRISGDLVPASWTLLLTAFTSFSVVQGGHAPVYAYGGPNHWLDLDCLVTGAPGITDDEGRTSMALWSIQAAPLLIGADVRTASTPSGTTIATLTNADVIGVDQDALGIIGLQVSSVVCGSATCQVWAKPLSGGACAIGLFNLDSGAHDITGTFSAVAAVFPACGTGPYTTTRDLWAHSSLGTLTTSYTATAVPAHGVAMIRVAP